MYAPGAQGDLKGENVPRAGVRGKLPREKNYCLGKHVMCLRKHVTYLGGFQHMVFANGFLFLVKELGFWTNPGHWVRVLDASGS